MINNLHPFETRWFVAIDRDIIVGLFMKNLFDNFFSTPLISNESVDYNFRKRP